MENILGFGEIHKRHTDEPKQYSHLSNMPLVLHILTEVWIPQDLLSCPVESASRSLAADALDF